MTRIKIGRVARNKPHLFADTLEIVCAYEGGPVSETDAISLLQNAPFTAEDAIEIEAQDLDDDGIADGSSSAELSAKQQAQIEACFQTLEYRCKQFGDSYPFEIEGRILKAKGEFSKLNCFYLFLLSCSRSRTFREIKGSGQTLADIFELASKDCLASMMPADATTVCFGASSAERKHEFGTDLREAIPKLAEFMGMKLSNHFDPDEYAAQGDGKIDLVAVQQLDDLELGWNVFLGQCAAREEEGGWADKRQEALFELHRTKFDALVPSQGVLFVPVSYRQPSGKFVSKKNVGMVIFMDRDRIMPRFSDELPGFARAAEFICDEFMPLFLK